ncbi:hypothetical protein CVT24_002720 [Panaeolus cyanescens]|uniref:Reverse transcriptase domain-containing protein n=1 Tax=Panaeolus cyanescens TaxID=181874 RepID=A0A409WPY5_9AGAR|nr:hypothetical protein CVT24_002720 [Panaeolus cyanescens]
MLVARDNIPRPPRSRAAIHPAATNGPFRQLATALALGTERARARCPLVDFSQSLSPARVFPRAQAQKSYRPALSVWGATSTTSSTAVQSKPSTASFRPWPKESMVHCSPSRVVPHCATIFNPTENAKVPPTTSDTDALGVPLPLMVLRSALEHRRETNGTPYHVDSWRRVLRMHGLLDSYRHVVQGLELGFMVGFPEITSTQLPQNRPSVDTHHAHFLSIIRDKLQKGRYIGPAKRTDLLEALGPLQSSPISIIPKTSPGKFRVVQNFSFPHQPSLSFPSPSVNSFTNPDSFPCTWGTFRSMCIVISALPDGSQMAVRDVAEAYRTVPLHHSQWPAAVVRINDDLFVVDTCAAFGAAPSGGVFGSIADAGCDIFRAEGMGPLSKWIDDHVFFRVLRSELDTFNLTRREWQKCIREQGVHHHRSRRWFGGQILQDDSPFDMFEDCSFPLHDLSGDSPRSSDDAQYCYNMDDIDRVSAVLGIPWQSAKDVQFSSSAPYFGFVWDLKDRTVALSLEKASKYKEAIQAWGLHAKHALLETQQLYGKLLHASLVIPSGRSRLVGLELAIALAHSRPFASRFPPRSVAGELTWWYERLSQPRICRPIHIPSSVVDLQAFSDASTGFGVGICVGEGWRAWRLLPSWRTRGGVKDIGWAEAVGFYLLISHITSCLPPATHFRVFCDNEGVVGGWKNGRSRNSATNSIFCLALDLLEDRGFDGCAHCSYVPSARNPADGPSRGVYPSPHLLLPSLPIPDCLQPFISDVVEHGTMELDASSSKPQDSEAGEDSGNHARQDNSFSELPWPSSEDELDAISASLFIGDPHLLE